MCMYRLAAADDADRLLQEAKQELQNNCQPKACAVLSSALAKLKRAYAVQPGEQIAETACQYGRYAKKSPAEEADVIAFCDIVDDDYADSLRETRLEKGRASSPITAIRALYGVGLTFSDADDGKSTLAYGAITAQAMQDLARDHYHAIEHFSDLTEPSRKVRICKLIADTIKNTAERKEIVEWCEWMSAGDENGLYMAFAGPTGLEPVKKLDKNAAVFQIDAQLHYQPAFVITRKKRLDKPQTLLEEQRALKAIVEQGEQHSHYKDAVARRAEIDAFIKKRKAESEKARKLIDSRTSQVSFLPYVPVEWDVPAPLTGHVEKCRAVAAVAPGIGKESGDTELLVKVDGKQCIDSYATEVAPADECPELLTAGKHTIEAELFRVIWKKTGGKQITIHSKDNIDVRDKEAGSRGKRVARGQITCGATK